MRWMLLALAWGLAQPAAADEPLELDALLANFGWDLASAEIRSQELDEGLYVLYGLGGNIAVSIGEDGVLVVDDQFPELVPRVKAAIAALGGGPIDYAINTHWHFDHAEGNRVLGPAGTTLVAHANARRDLASGGLVNLVVARYLQRAYPPDALPTITYDERMQLHYNGGRIDLIHAGPAHTTGDTAVVFRRHGAVHLGDVFNHAGYPFIDVDSGGDVDGVIAFCRAILAELPERAIVIPGHGEVTDRAALEAYVTMLETVRGRVDALIAEGSTLEEAIAARPTADFDATYGEESKSLGFVNRVYTSLKKNGAGVRASPD